MKADVGLESAALSTSHINVLHPLSALSQFGTNFAHGHVQMCASPGPDGLLATQKGRRTGQRVRRKGEIPGDPCSYVIDPCYAACCW